MCRAARSLAARGRGQRSAARPATNRSSCRVSVLCSTAIGFANDVQGRRLSDRQHAPPMRSTTGHLNGLRRGAGRASPAASSDPDAPFGVDEESDSDLLPKIVADAPNQARNAERVASPASTSARPTDERSAPPVPVSSVAVEQKRRGAASLLCGRRRSATRAADSRCRRAGAEPTPTGLSLAAIAGRARPHRSRVQPGLQVRGDPISTTAMSEIDAQDPRKPGELMQVNLREPGLLALGQRDVPQAARG